MEVLTAARERLHTPYAPVMRARTTASFALIATLFAGRASGQTTPQESLRPGPTPMRVGHGEALGFARTMAVAQDGPATLVAYLENTPSGRAQLRTALFTVEGRAREDLHLVRQRPDVTIPTDGRALAVSWGVADGGMAVVAVPPVRNRPAPGAPVMRRAPPTGLPPSTLDPLGPSNSSGGDIAVIALDATGAAVGAPRVVFHENARLSRVAIVREADGFALAWTGAMVTDDEVRETVRLMRVDRTGTPRTTMALATGLSGDNVGALDLVRVSDGGLGQVQSVLRGTWTTVVAALPECRDGRGLPALPPAEVDPSSRIAPPNRQLMPQTPPREQDGPPLDCAQPRLAVLSLGEGDRFVRRFAAIPIRSLSVARRGNEVTALLNQPDGPRLAGVSLVNGALRRLDGQPLAQIPPAAPIALDFTLRTPTPPDHAAEINEAPLTPPEDAAPLALAAPSVVASLADRTFLASPGHRAVYAFATTATPLFTSPLPVMELHPLEAPTARFVLAREGLWSGPMRLIALDGPAHDPDAFTRLTAVRVPAPVINPRLATRTPYTFDAAFARHWVHARTLRGVFMAFENTAGALAARPEALTDPRMPNIVANRNRLRARWESACSTLQSRAQVLARQGAGQELLDGVRSLCELHGDLQLGVPVNPAL